MTYQLDIYTLGMFAMFCVVIGVFGAAAIGAWLEGRKLGRRPFTVNTPDIQLTPITCDELEALLYEDHIQQKGHQLQ